MMVFFPSDWVKEQIAYQVQTSSKKKLLVSIGEAKSSGLFGVALENISLYESKRGKRVPGQTDPPPRANTLLGSLDAVSLSPSIFGLLSGKVGADLGVSLAGGDVDASVGFDTSNYFFGTDIDAFQLGAHPIDTDDLNVELSGLLNLASDISINRDNIKDSSGTISLNVDNLALKKATISGFDLETTTFSEAALEMEVEDGKAKVTKGSFVGDLLEATIEGHITLRKDISRSRLSLKILVRFDETLDKLAKMMLKSSRDEDGVYHFKGQGTLMSPRFRADRITRRGAANKRGAASDKETFDSPSTSSRSRKRSAVTDEDREERRSKRRERLKKRRERMKKRREERRERERDRGGDYEREPEGSEEFDDNAGRRDYAPQGEYEEEADRDYGTQNDYNNANDGQYNNDPQYQGNDAQYEDANGANENMEDLGYIDE